MGTDIEKSGGEKNLKQIHKINNRLDNYIDITYKIKKYIWNSRCGRQERQITVIDATRNAIKESQLVFLHLSHQQIFIQHSGWTC